VRRGWRCPQVTILSPSEYVGGLITLCEESGGQLLSQSFLSAEHAMLQYSLPLAEIATEFHDRLRGGRCGTRL